MSTCASLYLNTHEHVYRLVVANFANGDSFIPLDLRVPRVLPRTAALVAVVTSVTPKKVSGVKSTMLVVGALVDSHD